MDRRVLFISHAAPEDNEFTRWLSLRLIGMGYEVWSDVIKLKGGEDWWKVIENEIRSNAVKFLLVLSKSSNQKDGVLKELAVAQKVIKKLEDQNFIVPLHIDKELSYDDINIELNRFNSINFKKSWAAGLSMLMERLEEDSVPRKETNFDQVANLWQNVFLSEKSIIKKAELFTSNWFRITEFPEVLRFHYFKYAIPKGFNLKTLTFPAVRYRDYLVTFGWCYDFMHHLPKTEKYDQNSSYEISTNEILEGNYDSDFLKNRDAKNLVVRLLNEAFDKFLKNKNLTVYEMSNSKSYFLEKDVLEKDKYGKIKLVGKQKEKQWHFGISASAKLFPENCFVIKSHIWFTSDGHELIPGTSKQHSSRRRQGRNWWNNDWRNKMHSFTQFLAEGNSHLVLDVGSEEVVKVSSSPIEFQSPVTYLDPNKSNLPDEDFDIDDDPEEEV